MVNMMDAVDRFTQPELNVAWGFQEGDIPAQGTMYRTARGKREHLRRFQQHHLANNPRAGKQTKKVRKIQQTMNDRLCGNPLCLKKAEAGEEFMRCSGCQHVNYCSKVSDNLFLSLMMSKN